MESAPPTTTTPHVLIAAFPGQGHAIPAISLATRLASAGFRLTFVSFQHDIIQIRSRLSHYPADLAHLIHCVGLPSPPITPHPQHHLNSVINDTRPADPSTCSDDIDAANAAPVRVVEASQMMSVGFELFMQELVTNPEGNPFGSPVAIISDHFCPWTQAVATKLGIPRYVLYPTSAKLLALLFYLPSIVAANQMSLQCNFASDDGAMTGNILVPELGPISIHELPKSLTYTSSSSSYQIVHQFFHQIACLLHQSSGVIVNSFPGLESRALDALINHKALNPNRVPIFSLGPILPYPISTDHNIVQTAVSHDSRKPVTGWLNTQSPSSVLYISFGSVYVPSLAQIYEIAVGLRSSQLPFFWVLRFPSISELANPSAIFSFLPEGFEQHTQKHGIIVTSWVPQPLILSHPSIGGFFTHCGWNSTIESIYSGVPMIAFPQMAEQRLVCGMVVDEWKVGIRLQRENDGLARGAELERATKRLLATSEEEAIFIRKRMLEMKKAARRAVMDEDGSSSSSNLRSFIKDIIAKSNNKGSLATNGIKT